MFIGKHCSTLQYSEVKKRGKVRGICQGDMSGGMSRGKCPTLIPSGCAATSKNATDMERITNCLMNDLRLHDTDKLRSYLRTELPVFE